MALSAQTKSDLDIALASKAAGDEIQTILNTGTAGGDPLHTGDLVAGGLMARTGSGTSAVRTVTGTANQVTVANGSGVSGNPTISLPVSIDITTSYKIGGTKVVGAQGTAIPDVTPAADGTAAGTTLNLLLAALRTHGLIAT